MDNLKVADRFLAARPGARFRNMTLVRYASDVVEMGLRDEPDCDRNPYNFVPWIGDKPSRAQEPERAFHDKISHDRLSGRITVTFTARTPIFVPEGQLQENDDRNESSPPGKTLDFFHCWDGSCCRYAIPGASVKGAVRSLFEALTNSRTGVTDDAALGRPPLYRRRATRLFQVVSMPSGNVDGRVQECEYVLYGRNGQPRRRSNGYDDRKQARVQDWRANLFWVEPAKHCHGNRMKFYPVGRYFTLTREVLEQFKLMKGHPHLKQHGGKKGNAARVPPANRMYTSPVPKYSAIEDDLFHLDQHDLIFGIPVRGRNELQCFGKNVNFLWPAASSLLSMMGSCHSGDRGVFAAREPEEQQVRDSDPAEATFGFAGRHIGDSHPFRGRVRFGTFWGPCVTESKPDSLQLMPLTAPSGTKAKARPLYLEGASDGKSADFDSAARLRGRKFYWHQQGKDRGNIPGVHDLNALSVAVPGQWRTEIESQLPDPIRPLPSGKRFRGTLHFTNLTEAELGALLVSIEPDLAFGSAESTTASAATDSPVYGIKLGKGKPRGLGSVTATIELELATGARERYCSFDARLAKKEMDTVRYVNAYKNWCVLEHQDQAGTANWADLDMAKALKALLRIPNAPSVRVYPPQFAMYGWLPDLNEPHGKPKGPRPKAMTPAHKLKGP